jgi:hypothetical protein
MLNWVKRHLKLSAVAFLLLLLLASSFIPYYRKICEKQPQAAVEDCATYQLTPLIFVRSAKFFEGHAEAFIALFTVVLSISTILLWRSTYRLWKTSRDTLETTKRAFVYIDGFNYELTVLADTSIVAADLPQEIRNVDPALHVTRFACQPRWKNSGNTPTVGMRIRVDWDFALVDHREVGAYRFPATLFFVGPQSASGSDFVDIPVLNEIIQGGFAGSVGSFATQVPDLLIWGRADYEDIFRNRHSVEWCYRIRPERHTGEKLRVSFIQWGNYNRTDEDS